MMRFLDFKPAGCLVGSATRSSISIIISSYCKFLRNRFELAKFRPKPKPATEMELLDEETGPSPKKSRIQVKNFFKNLKDS